MPPSISPRHGLWQHPDFLRLWSAQTVSSFGARISREGLPLAALLTIQASPSQLGILAALSSGPALLVGLLAGSHVDRSQRRPLLIGADLLRALLLLSIPLAAWAGQLSMPLLYLVAALIGAANTLFDIADHAYLPSLVSPTQLIEGNAKLAVTDSVAEVGGPALAGLLVQCLSAPFTLALSGVGYLFSAGALARIRTAEPAAAPSAEAFNWWQDFRDGLAFTLRHPLVRPLLLSRLTANLFGSFLAALYSLYALRELGLSTGILGLTIAAGGIGGLLGAALLPWLTRRLPLGRAILLAAFGCGLLNLLIPAAHGAPLVCMIMLMAAQLGGDALAVAAAIAGDSLRQSALPPRLLGRVAAVFHAGGGLMAIVGALLGGALAEVLGLRATIWISVLGLAAAPLWLWASPLRQLVRMPQAATAGGSA